MTDRERLNELFELVRHDPRLQNIDVALQPALFTLHIGGPGIWTHKVNLDRLQAGDLAAYAQEIVDSWEL